LSLFSNKSPEQRGQLLSQYIVLPPSLLQPEATEQWLTSFGGASSKERPVPVRYFKALIS